MTLSVQPVLKTSYTERGNEYKESNIGKYAATAGVAGASVLYGGEYAFKGAKKLFNKAKIIKLDLSKIKKPDFKQAAKSVKNLKNNIPSMKAVKTFVKSIPSKMLSELKNIGQFAKNTFKKINTENIKKVGKSAIDFVKTNLKKVNVNNMKKAGKAIVKFAQKPSVKFGAGIAAGFAGVLALGYVADVIANKISAKKADKI